VFGTSAEVSDYTGAYILKIKGFTPKMEGRAVAQLVEALRYKPERRGFDSRFTGIFH
jgi:hypothetical protein